MKKQIIAGFLAMAAAGATSGMFDAQTGQRVGTVRQEGARVDLFNERGERTGWGRCDGQGRCEVFDREGRRIGETRDGRVILTDPTRLQGKEGRR